MPGRRCVVVNGSLHFRVEADVPGKLVTLDERAEILEQLVALREVLAPALVGLERIRIEVVGDIDTAARVAVLVPRATDGVVLLDDRERDARLLESQTLQESRHPGADHKHTKPFAYGFGHGPAPARLARIDAIEREFLEHDRDVVVRHALAGDEAHHLPHGVPRRRWRQRAAAIAIGLEGFECCGAHRGVLLGREPAVILVDHRLLRADRPVQQARVAGYVHNRHHQRWHARVLEHARERRVVLGDRLLCGLQVNAHRGLPAIATDGDTA